MAVLDVDPSDDEQLVCRGRLEAFLGEVVDDDGGEEPGCDQAQPLMPAFAVGDEDAMLPESQVLQPHPADLAAPQCGEQHRFDHRSVPAHARAHIGRQVSELVGSDESKYAAGGAVPCNPNPFASGEPHGYDFSACLLPLRELSETIVCLDEDVQSPRLPAGIRVGPDAVDFARLPGEPGFDAARCSS